MPSPTDKAQRDYIRCTKGVPPLSMGRLRQKNILGNAVKGIFREIRSTMNGVKEFIWDGPKDQAKEIVDGHVKDVLREIKSVLWDGSDDEK